jgi:putative addiction module component (TIGR02574 family)
MDAQSLLEVIGSWPVEERLRLMDGIWAGLVDDQHERDLTPEQTEEIGRRLDEIESAPDEVVSWAEIKAAALKWSGR